MLVAGADAVDALPVMVWTADADGLVTYVNAAGRAFAGALGDQLLGDGWLRLLEPSDRAACRSAYRAAIARGLPFSLEFSVRGGDGARRWLRAQGTPHADGDGVGAGWTGAWLDVTELHEAQETAQRSHDAFEALFESLPIGATQVEPGTGRLLRVNQAYCRITGYRREQLLGMRVRDLTHPDDWSATVQLTRALLADDSRYHIEKRYLRPDGSVVWVRADGTLVRDRAGQPQYITGIVRDITSERRALDALRQRDQLLLTVLESLASHVVVLDRAGHIAYASKSWERFAGESASAMTQVTVGTDYLAVCRQAAAAGDPVARATADGIEAVMARRVREFEIEYPCAGDGRPQWLLLHVDAMPADHGGVVVTHTNITARKTAEIELAEQKARYQNIFETAGVALWEADFTGVKALVDDLVSRVDGDLSAYLAAHPEVVQQALALVRLRAANPFALRTYGAASTDEVSQHFLHHATPEACATFAMQLEAIARGRTYMEAETVVETRSGEHRHVIYTVAFPRPGERFDRVLFSVLDVTERHQAQAALRESEQRYRAVVESQTDLLCRYRADTTLTFVNDAYCRYFNRSREALIGTRFIDLVPVEARAEVLARVDDLLRERRGLTSEHRVLRPDGTIGWQQWTDHPVLGPDGAVLEIQAVGRDVTDRRLAEEALHASQQALRVSHDRIQLLAGKLLTAQEEERRRISRELHDGLNQKLAALAIGLSNLRRRLPPGDRRLRDDAAALHEQARALAGDIRSLSHDLHPAVLEHAGLRAALQAHCAEFTAASGVSVRLEVADDAADLPRDIALGLYRVTQESLHNIARHSGSRDARVSLRTDGAWVHLAIEDTGRGFDADAGRTRSGLGLVSMRERVRLLQGTLDIQSRPGLTALVVRLPLPGPGR